MAIRRAEFETKYDLKSRYQKFADEEKTPEQMFKDFESGWRSNGTLPDGEEFTIGDAVRLTSDRQFADAVTSTDMPAWIPRVINNQIREAVEPVLVGENLLQRIEFKPGQQVSLGTMNALAGDFEVSEAGELPEFQINYGDGTAIRTVGRIGAALRFSPDIIRWSSYPVIGLHTRALARALKRYKEEKIFTFISEEGQLIFDNDSPTDSVLGITTGKDMKYDLNGSFTADDLADLFVQVMKNGFMPNTILMNTLTWMMFRKDPVLRYMFVEGNGGTYFGSFTGNAQAANDWPNMNGLGLGKGQFSTPSVTPGGTPTPVWQFPPTTAAPVFPNYWGHPLRIVVSPFVPFDETTNRTDLYVFDSQELGYMVVDHDLQVKDWTDPNTDIYTIAMDERYSLQIANEGQGVAIAKSIQVNPGNQAMPYVTPSLTVTEDQLDFDHFVSPYTSGS